MDNKQLDGSSALAEQLAVEGGESLVEEVVTGLAGVAGDEQFGGGVGVFLEGGGLGGGGVFVEGEGGFVDEILVLLAHACALELSQPHLVAADLPEGRFVRADGHDLVLAEAGELLEVPVPAAQVVLVPHLLDYPQRQQLRVVLGEGAPAQEVPGPGCDVVLEELDEGVVESILLEEHAAGEVEVEEGDEGGVLDLVVECLEDGPFCLFVVLLRVALVGVALVSVEVGHVLIEFHSFCGNDEGCGCPELLGRVQSMQQLEEVKCEGECFLREEELVGDGREQLVGFLVDLARLKHLGGRPAQALEVVMEVEMEGRGVFGGLDCLRCVIELSAGHATVPAEAVRADYYLSGITHFSIKINNTITRTPHHLPPHNHPKMSIKCGSAPVAGRGGGGTMR